MIHNTTYIHTLMKKGEGNQIKVWPLKKLYTMKFLVNLWLNVINVILMWLSTLLLLSRKNQICFILLSHNKMYFISKLMGKIFCLHIDTYVIITNDVRLSFLRHKYHSNLHSEILNLDTFDYYDTSSEPISIYINEQTKQ